MTLPLIKNLRAGSPPTKVIFLPDGMFFTRTIAIAAGSSAIDVTAQVELALETLSPFPPTQLYHGYFWPPGALQALVFAAYRRRFTNEQLDGWDHAELVIPTFAALLGGDIRAETTLIIPSVDGLTAVYWDQSPVPSKIVFRAIQTDATDEDWTRVRDQLAAAAPSSHVIVVNAPPAPVSTAGDRELAFRAEAFSSRLPVALSGALDVRDKLSLATLRRARARDLGLWRGFLAIVGLLVLLGLGEIALVGAAGISRTRLAQLNGQRPVVERIMTAQSVTTRINELSTKRLLPFEMIAQATGPKPESVTFSRVSTVGLNGLSVEAESTSPAAPSAYQAALSALPTVEKVEVRDQRARDNVLTFTLAVTFRPETIKAGSTP